MSRLFSGKRILKVLVIAALTAVVGVLFFMPADKAEASEILLPGFVKDMIASGEIDPKDEKGKKYIEDITFSKKDVEAEYEKTYKKTKWNDSFDKTDLKYLSCIIYCEANSMSEEGKIAVGNVILNRLRAKGDWAHVTTIKEVIYDRKWAVQFSPTINGSLKKALALYKSMDPSEFREWEIEYMEDSIQAAKQVLRGKKVIPDDFLYFNGSVTRTKEKCEAAGSTYRIIGGHIYFRNT